MSLPSHVREYYRVQILQLVNKFLVSGRKLSQQKQHLIFNLQCPKMKLLPRVKPLIHTKEGERVAKRVSELFLNVRISHNITIKFDS